VNVFALQNFMGQSDMRVLWRYLAQTDTNV
jgi:hypothetical protein